MRNILVISFGVSFGVPALDLFACAASLAAFK
jgi:hypothetical protein